MLSVDLKMRPSAQLLLTHEFFKVGQEEIKLTKENLLILKDLKYM